MNPWRTSVNCHCIDAQTLQTSRDQQLLKLVGKTEGLDAVRKDLGSRFGKRRRGPGEEKRAA